MMARLQLASRGLAPYMLVLLLSNYVTAQPLIKNACHANSIKAVGSDCAKVVLPRGFCSSCDIGEINGNGNYLDCTRTMQTESPQCLPKMQDYVDMNPCDDARAVALEEFQSDDAEIRETGRLKWDFFLYSVCEQACDCIPLQASENVPAVEVRRGNCQTHTFFDVCRVLPDIKLIVGEGTPDEDVTNLDEVCPSVIAWWRSDDSLDWRVRDDHFVADHVKYFLERAIEATEMTSDVNFYNSCVNLEATQTRIAEVDNGWRTLTTKGEPTGRHEACFVWHEGKAYLIGGRENPDIDEFDPETLTWTTHPNTSLNIHHSQCISLNGKIWFPGAWTGAFPRERDWETMPVYDPATQTWDLSRNNIPLSRRRGSGASVAYQGKIYHSHGNTGGHNDEAMLVRLFDVYDPGTDTWAPLPPPPNARDHTGGAVVRMGNQDMMCVSGGRDSAGTLPEAFRQYVLPTDCYSFDAGTWSVMPDIPTPRAGANYGTTCDNKLMVAGGEVFENRALDVVEVFDGSTWTEAPPLEEGRHGSGLAFDCTFCGEAYIASGNPTRGGGPDLDSTEILDTGVCDLEKPTPRAPPTPAPPSPSPTISPTPAPATVAGFSLIDAATDLSIVDNLVDGAIITLPPETGLNIRANVRGSVDGVRFGLDGNANFRVERKAPFAVFGDLGGDYNSRQLSAGQHTVTATTLGSSLVLTVSFAIEYGPIDDEQEPPTEFPTSTPVSPPLDDPVTRVASLSLVDSTTKSVVVPSIQSGSTISLPSGGMNFNIEANLLAGDFVTDRVEFKYDNAVFRIEKSPPYLLFGDRNGVYFTQPITEGPHTLEAKHFPSGLSLVIDFAVGYEQ